MLQNDKIDILEGIDIDKTNASKECDICHQVFFLDKNFKYKPYLCNGCYDLLQKAIKFNDIAIVSAKGSDCRIYFWYMSKNCVINIMKKLKLK